MEGVAAATHLDTGGDGGDEVDFSSMSASDLAHACPAPIKPASSMLDTDGSLAAGKSLKSANGEYKAEMQFDGNLVIYHNGHHVKWASDTRGRNPRLIMQGDGNLVLYHDDGVLWASDTMAKTEAAKAKAPVLYMEDSGALVLYNEDGGDALWASDQSQVAVRRCVEHGPIGDCLIVGGWRSGVEVYGVDEEDDLPAMSADDLRNTLIYELSELAKSDCTRHHLLLSSHRGVQLEDRHNNVGMHVDTGDWQMWTLEDAGDGLVFIKSHRGKMLEDRDGNVGLSDHTGDWQKWRFAPASGGKWYIKSHRDQHLEDRHGNVGVHNDAAGWQEWTVKTIHSQFPCVENTDRVATDMFQRMDNHHLEKFTRERV
jgi:hypothetical protein